MKRLEETTIINSGKNPRNRLLVVSPTLGIVRAEWAIARYGQMIPPNWSMVYSPIQACMPMNYLVAEAQNIGVQSMMKSDFEWLFFHEDDVVLPLDCFLKLNRYMKKADYPIVSGLYYLKSNPPEPILYRGLGNSYYDDFKIGDKVWVDGVPTGCLLIHRSVLEVMYNEAEEYELPKEMGSIKVRRVFETPTKMWPDPEIGMRLYSATSDLDWCKKVIDNKVLKRAGWPKLAKKKYPLLCDTSIFCKHIDLQTGTQYPIGV